MGRRKSNISQSMVLNIMLAPLTESFYIGKSDTTQQWYYANDNSYLPNRTTDSLVLTPNIEVYDPDTLQTYVPTWHQLLWFYLDAGHGTYNGEGEPQTGGDYVLIPQSGTAGADYWAKADGTLIVKKNVPYDAPVTLLCVGWYIDPRTAGTTYKVRDKVDLVTNRDATQIMPTIDINCESVQVYDPFKDASSLFTFTAKVLDGITDVTSQYTIKWFAFNETITTETLIDSATTVDGVSVKTFPCYVSGQNTATLTLDAMYAERISVVARIVESGSTLYPCKALRNLVWDDIPISGITHSNNSGAVRDNTTEMEFDTIVNVKDMNLSEEQKQTHLAFKWFRRNAQSTSSDTLIGWAQKIVLRAQELRQWITMLVYSKIFIKGANEYVTSNGQVVTSAPDGGTREAVFCRTIDDDETN